MAKKGTKVITSVRLELPRGKKVVHVAAGKSVVLTADEVEHLDRQISAGRILVVPNKAAAEGPSDLDQGIAN